LKVLIYFKNYQTSLFISIFKKVFRLSTGRLTYRGNVKFIDKVGRCRIHEQIKWIIARYMKRSIGTLLRVLLTNSPC
jgi:hypothetical protein